MGQRARIARMLVALADRLARQEQHGAFLRQLAGEALDDTADNGRIDRERQMRAVLLGGADGQHGDQLAVVEPREGLAGICLLYTSSVPAVSIRPPALSGGCPGPCACLT